MIFHLFNKVMPPKEQKEHLIYLIYSIQKKKNMGMLPMQLHWNRILEKQLQQSI
jgi:hypothetical protein